MRMIKRSSFLMLLALFFLPFPVHADHDTLHIMLDPGHGGDQSGAERSWEGETISEKDINLSIAELLKQELEQYEDVTVSLTRTGDQSLTLEERTAEALEEDADIMISLHNNAHGDCCAYDHGCTVLTAKGPYKEEFALKQQELACNILHELSGLGIEDQGILIRTSETGDTYPDGTLADYYGLVRAGVKHDLPTVIIEHAFLDSDSDYQEYLCDEEKLEKLAAADARGIARYYQLVSEDEEEALPSLESVKEKLVLVKDNNAAHNEIFYKVYYDDDSRENSQTGMAGEDDDDSGEEQMIREVIDAIIKMLTHNK